MLEYLAPELNNWLRPYFRYRTPKYILVEVPLVGIIHRLGQIGALIYVIYTMVEGNTWAMTTVPLGSVNPWVEAGGYTTMGRDTADYASVSYCSNPAHAYKYSASFLYGSKEMPPICESPNYYTITQKTVDSVFVTTAYIEENEWGFPCGAGGATLKDDEEACNQKMGVNSPNGFLNATLTVRKNGQCVCTGPSKTYYPLGAEKMDLLFAHFFSMPTLKTQPAAEPLSGSSDINETEAEFPLHTELVFANGTTMNYEAGAPITIPIQTLLLAAHQSFCEDGGDASECKAGVTLDERNVHVRPDADDPQKFPIFRTTGVMVQLEITYTNENPNTKRASYGRRNVAATVKATVQTGAWSSVGGTTTFKQYPSGEVGNETCVGQPMNTRVLHFLPSAHRNSRCGFRSGRWELSSRYKQGVTVDLKSTGSIYTFDAIFLIEALVTGLVLLKFSNTVADFVAFYLLAGGQSLVLRNKRAEKVSKKSEFAETGLKAALAAHQFSFFDRDHNGDIEAVDIVRAFANIERPDDGGAAVTAEQAHAIATAIMEDADIDGPTTSLTGTVRPGTLDFSEFMTCIDGDAIAFSSYLKKLPMRQSLEDYPECEEAYDAQRKVAMEHKIKRPSFVERHPSMAAQMKEASEARRRSSTKYAQNYSSKRKESDVESRL